MENYWCLYCPEDQSSWQGLSHWFLSQVKFRYRESMSMSFDRSEFANRSEYSILCFNYYSRGCRQIPRRCLCKCCTHCTVRHVTSFWLHHYLLKYIVSLDFPYCLNFDHQLKNLCRTVINAKLGKLAVLKFMLQAVFSKARF